MIAGGLKPGVHQPPDGMLAMIDSWPPQWIGMLIRQEAVRAVGYDWKAGTISDGDFEFRMAGIFPIFVSSEPGAIFYNHDQSLHLTSKLRNSWSDWLHMMSNIQGDKRIPKPARATALRALTQWGGKALRAQGWRAALLKQWADAEAASAILKEGFHWSGSALALDAARSVLYGLLDGYRGIGGKWKWHAREAVLPGHQVPKENT